MARSLYELGASRPIRTSVICLPRFGQQSVPLHRAKSLCASVNISESSTIGCVASADAIAGRIGCLTPSASSEALGRAVESQRRALAKGVSCWAHHRFTRSDDRQSASFIIVTDGPVLAFVRAAAWKKRNPRGGHDVKAHKARMRVVQDRSAREGRRHFTNNALCI